MEQALFGVSVSKIENLLDEYTWEANDLEEVCRLQSKKVYHHHYEGDPRFSYRMTIEANVDYENNTGVYVSLYLTPTFKSLHKSKQEDIDSGGYVSDDEVFCYGYAIPLASDYIKTSGSITEGMLNLACNAVYPIERMKAFYLDKPKNMLGTTGWNLLEDFINGKSFINLTLEKYEKNKEESA